MTVVENLPHVILHHGYLAVFLLSVLEGPIVTIVAAFLAYQGALGVGAVYATVVLGDLVGDLVYYAIGRWLITRLPWRVGIGRRALRRIEALRDHFHARAGRVLLFGKLTQSAGFAVLLAAGAARLRLDTFILYNFVGALPKFALFVVIGYFFGRSYKALSGDLQLAGLIGFAVLCLVMIPLIYRLSASRDPEGLE